MRLTTRIVLFVAFLIAMLLAMNVLRISVHDESPKNLYSSQARQDDAPCGKYGSIDELTTLRQAVIAKDGRCFQWIVNEASALNSARRIEAGAFLAEELIRSNEQGGVLVDDYSRLVTLNLLIPLALAGKIDFDAASWRKYILAQTKNPNSEIRAEALAVLAYFTDESDVEVFRAHINASSDAELAFAIYGLIEICSPKAKEALIWALSQERVKQYMKKYRDKETISELIARRCPITSQPRK